jgi:hypothetical protein
LYTTLRVPPAKKPGEGTLFLGRAESACSGSLSATGRGSAAPGAKTVRLSESLLSVLCKPFLLTSRQQPRSGGSAAPGPMKPRHWHSVILPDGLKPQLFNLKGT